MIEVNETFDIRYIDPSSFSTFSRCPAKYMLSRQMGLSVRGSRMIAPDFGTCIHAALPYAYSLETLPTAYEIFDAQWADFGYGEDDPKRNTQRGHDTLLNFCTIRTNGRCPYEVIELPSIATPDGVDKISKNEQPFIIDIGAPLALAGRIDLIIKWKQDGKLYPCDYKGQPLTSQVLTPYGFVDMGNIRVGSLLAGINGKTQEVLGVFPLGKRKVFEVTFSDGSKTRCTWDHLWKVTKRLRKAPRVMELKDIVMEGIYEDAHKTFQVPDRRCVEFEFKPVEIDPYLLGCLLGDGNKTRLTSADPEIVERIARRNPGIVGSVGHHRSDWKTFTYYMKETIPAMRRLGILDLGAKEKRVPPEYMINTAEIRREILKGLMDTDGSVSVNRTPIFTTTSKGLAYDVRFIVESLGGVCTINEYESKVHNRVYGKYYMLFVQLTDVFSLSRKADKVAVKLPKLLIESVVCVGEEECQCIKVSNSDGMYITDDFILTHNTASEISPRLFDSFWNAPQPLGYTIAASHLLGERVPGLMIEAIRVSKVNDEVQLYPVYCPDHLIERFIEECKIIATKMLICNEQKRWPRNCAACSSYAMFGLPGFTCPYQPICEAKDWTSMVPLFERNDPWHPFVVKAG